MLAKIKSWVESGTKFAKKCWQKPVLMALIGYVMVLIFGMASAVAGSAMFPLTAMILAWLSLAGLTLMMTGILRIVGELIVEALDEDQVKNPVTVRAVA